MLNWIFNRRDPATSAEFSRFQREQQERAEKFRHAWKSYEGGLAKPLRVRQGEYDDNVCLSLPRLVVDKGVAALYGEEVHFEVEDGVGKDDNGDETRTPEQEYLDRAWEANQKMTFLHALATNGGVYGHPFIRVAPRVGDVPRLINPCPEQMDILFDPEDSERILGYVQTWHGVDQITSKVHSYRDIYRCNFNAAKEPLNWTIIRETAVEGDTWRERQRPEFWPYATGPIFQCQNLLNPNCVWGMSDIEPDILSVNHAINFAASNINRILRYHAHPKLIGKGFQASQVDLSVDGVVVLPSKDSDMYKIEELQSLEDALSYLNMLKDSWDEQTRIPGIARGKVEDVGTLSGVALRILYGPLMEKTAVKRLLYGDMLTRLCRFLLEMEFGESAAQKEIEVKWGNAMPSDEKGEAEVAEIHSRIGVSRYTLLERLGYDPDKEAEKKAEEDDEAMNREAELMQARFDRGAV